MFDKNKHKTILVKILKDIYSDKDLRNILGFKGGTALFLFYNLPRISVDLDFNLLDEEKKSLVFEKLKNILSKFGKIVEAKEKRYTLFFLISYGKGERKIKVEVSKRKIPTAYEVKDYLGISILVAKKECLAAGKLSAFLTRKKLASRDLFDLWFILEKNWSFDENLLKFQTNLSLKKALKEALKKVKEIKTNQLLQGIGELIEEKDKNWIKNNLKKELIFLLNLYLKNQ
jgi:predicted nucleotidyltransferase component of viral defense system